MAKVDKMLLTCSNCSPSSSRNPHPANSSLTSIEKETSQARNSYRRFELKLKRRPKVLAITPDESSSQVVDNNESTSCADKIHRLSILHFKWANENKKEPVKRSELLGHQRQRCKAIDQVVFRCILYKEQIDIISYLFYE